MPDQPPELKKLASIAADMELDSDMRVKAIETIGRIGTRDALLVLLDLAANEDLTIESRDLSLKLSREIVKSGRR